VDDFVGDHDVFARLGPASVVVDATQGADGADDAVGRRLDVIGLFDDVTEGVFGSGLAAFEEAEGLGVAVEHEPIGKFELVDDGGGAPPVEEGLLDGVALGVVADGAVCLVAVWIDLDYAAGATGLARGARG